MKKIRHILGIMLLTVTLWFINPVVAQAQTDATTTTTTTDMEDDDEGFDWGLLGLAGLLGLLGLRRNDDKTHVRTTSDDRIRTDR